MVCLSGDSCHTGAWIEIAKQGHRVFWFSSTGDTFNLPLNWIEAKGEGHFSMFRQSIARPLELLESWIDGQVRQFRGNWREAGGSKGFMGLSNHDRNDRMFASWDLFQDIFPCVTSACWSKFVQWLSFQTWGCTIIWIFATLCLQICRNKMKKWSGWKLKPGLVFGRGRRKCVFLAVWRLETAKNWSAWKMGSKVGWLAEKEEEGGK